MKLKNYLLFGVIIMMFWLSGCSSDMKGNDSEMYSRADTEYMSDATLFGKNRSDDIYVALNFIYSDKSIQEKYGSEFEITADDIVCYTSEGESCFFPGLYKGYAEYSFTIGNDTYIVKLTKSLFGEWTVTEFLCTT